MITGETENMIEDHLAEDGYDDYVRRGKRKLSRAQRNALRARRRKLRVLRRKQRINKRIVRRSTPKRVNRRIRNRRMVSKVKRITSPKMVYPKVKKLSSIRTPSYVSGAYQNIHPIRSTTLRTNDLPKQTEPTTKKHPIGWYVIGGLTALGIIGVIAMKSRKSQY